MASSTRMKKELIAEAQAKLNNVMAQIQSLNADIDWNTMLSGDGSKL